MTPFDHILITFGFHTLAGSKEKKPDVPFGGDLEETLPHDIMEVPTPSSPPVTPLPDVDPEKQRADYQRRPPQDSGSPEMAENNLHEDVENDKKLDADDADKFTESEEV